MTIVNKSNLRVIALLIFATFVIASCNSIKKPMDKVELCQNYYLTEDEAVKKLEELSLNFSNADDWKERSKAIRENIIKGAELDKIPESDWNYSIKVLKNNKQIMNGYTVESVSLEVSPGHFVTGNLYQPDTLYEKMPAILSPHGHWSKIEDYGRFRDGMQYRCATLARMGAVVFAYDMVGYGENDNHKHTDPRTLTTQTYNGIRILDFICSLDYVDINRIAMTGASGGGTQTFILAAIDDRIAVSAPIVMVSAHMYGGCTCESGLPIHKSGDFETNNVEIAASIAPKPLLLIGDGDDWTKNLPAVEYPYIKNIYKMFNAEENVQYAYFAKEVHDYGPSKRKAMYPFMAKHLNLDLNKILDDMGEITEEFVVILDTTKLKVYPERQIIKNPKTR